MMGRKWSTLPHSRVPWTFSLFSLYNDVTKRLNLIVYIANVSNDGQIKKNMQYASIHFPHHFLTHLCLVCFLFLLDWETSSSRNLKNSYSIHIVSHRPVDISTKTSRLRSHEVFMTQILWRGWWWSYIKHGGHASDCSVRQGFNFCKGHTLFHGDTRYIFVRKLEPRLWHFRQNLIFFFLLTLLCLKSSSFQKIWACFNTFLLLPYNLFLLYTSKKHRKSFLCLPILMCHFFPPVNIDQQV